MTLTLTELYRIAGGKDKVGWSISTNYHCSNGMPRSNSYICTVENTPAGRDFMKRLFAAFPKDGYFQVKRFSRHSNYKWLVNQGFAKRNSFGEIKYIPIQYAERWDVYLMDNYKFSSNNF